MKFLRFMAFSAFAISIGCGAPTLVVDSGIDVGSTTIDAAMADVPTSDTTVTQPDIAASDIADAVDADAGDPFQAACTAAATARCTEYVMCSNFLGIHQYGDMPSCVARRTVECVTAAHAPGSGITPDQVMACATGVAAASCADLEDGNEPPPCNYAGSLSVGSSCYANAQCASGGCSYMHGATCGTCVTIQPVGAACGNGAGACGGTAVCIAGPTGGLVCTATVVRGGQCDAYHPCVASADCVTPVGTVGQGVCRASQTVVGGACDPDTTTMANCNNLRALYCDPQTRMCVPATQGALGQSCGGGGTIPSFCAPQLNCSSTSADAGNTCQSFLHDGDACSINGLPCIQPARCAVVGTATNGTCQILNQQLCR